MDENLPAEGNHHVSQDGCAGVHLTRTVPLVCLKRQVQVPRRRRRQGGAALEGGQWWACLEADQRPPRLCSPSKFVPHDYVDQDGAAEGLARPSGAPGPAITAASCVFQASEMKPEMRRLLFPRRGGGGGGDVKRFPALPCRAVPCPARLVHSSLQTLL